MNEPKSIENMNFEQALAELEEIVKRIDTGQESLENTINSFERGVALKNFCDNQLKEARLKIEKITKTADGSVTTEEVK